MPLLGEFQIYFLDQRNLCQPHKSIWMEHLDFSQFPPLKNDSQRKSERKLLKQLT